MLRFGNQGGVVTIGLLALCLPLAAQQRTDAQQTVGQATLRELEARIEEQQRQLQQLTAALHEQQQQIANMLQAQEQDGEKLKAETALQAPQLGEVASARPVILRAAAMTPSMATVPAAPQAGPAGAEAKPVDTPSFKLGVTLYPNFTFQEHPTITDTDGNVVRKSAFDVSRAYLNFTGNISHLIAFRITPDISRESSSSSALNGSLVYRIKYAFLQANLDDWMTNGSWARLGIQQTPYVDFMEGIYRYRFQGTTFAERAGFPFSSSDAGASFHYAFKSNYGDLHVGIYNGENYNKTDANQEKAIEMRFTVRPFANPTPVLRGFRATLFYDGDNYLQNAERKRLFGNVTFEHKFVVAAFEYMNTHDRTSATISTVAGRGYSIWATPRTTHGWEGLLRYDHWTPNTSSAFVTGPTAPDATTTFDSQKQNRMILGIAYWFPHEGSVSSALMFDYDAQVFRNIASTQPGRAFAIHGLISY